MRRKLLTPLLGIIAVAVILLSINLIGGYKPALGLDLQGGISVTMRPVPNQEYDVKSLTLAVERIRQRVDSFGVGEPEIIQQDDAIVVNLPGVNDQQQALDLVRVTGKVYLRPVSGCTTPTPTVTDDTTVGSPDTATGDTATGGTASLDTATVTGSSSPGPARASHPLRSSAVGPTIPPDTTTTTEPASTEPVTSDTATPGTDPVVITPVPESTTAPIIASDPTTSQYLPDRQGAFCLVGPAPAGATGEVFKRDSADSAISGGSYMVTLELTDSGLQVWNQLAAQCFAGAGECASKQLAIELDGVIQSHPVVEAPSYTERVQITGTFSKADAGQLADVINSGALPVTLQNEAVQAISASLGKDSLRAAIIAGIVGVGLVLALMVLYYKRLALIVILGLLLSGTIIYSVTALMSRFYNGVLSLSGIAGIIVSVGVTIDSYVVYFERLKDELRNGRSVRNSASRGFTGAWRAIIVADCASLIGAIVLWYLTVGSVRGFAFYLGLSTLTDLVIAYFFTRPAVQLLAQGKFLQGRKVLGVDTSRLGVELGGVS